MWVKFWSTALIAVFCCAAQGQNLPPSPGTTTEYQNGMFLLATNKDAEGTTLLLSACDLGDAVGCAELAMISNERFALVTAQRPQTTQAQLARKAIQLLSQICSPTEERNDGCAAYSAVLSNFSFMRVHPELVLEGGRMLAKRCLAGTGTADACSRTEPHLRMATKEERAALENWVNQAFEKACASGDSPVCAQGFFRKYSPDLTPELGQRMLRQVDASRQGCEGGSPVICVEAGVFLYEFTTGQGRDMAVQFIAAACQLPPKAGERDVQQAACETEKKMREAIAKGS